MEVEEGRPTLYLKKLKQIEDEKKKEIKIGIKGG